MAMTTISVSSATMKTRLQQLLQQLVDATLTCRNILLSASSCVLVKSVWTQSSHSVSTSEQNNLAFSLLLNPLAQLCYPPYLTATKYIYLLVISYITFLLVGFLYNEISLLTRGSKTQRRMSIILEVKSLLNEALVNHSGTFARNKSIKYVIFVLFILLQLKHFLLSNIL